MKNQKKGFTIIELLVVVAIIAMLSSAIFTFTAGIKSRSRDSRREKDIKEIQNALGLYWNSGFVFPICSEAVVNGTADCLSSALVSAGSASGLPVDPLGGATGVCDAPGNYVYCYESGDGLSYNLRYNLETNSIQGKFQGWQTAAP